MSYLTPVQNFDCLTFDSRDNVSVHPTEYLRSWKCLATLKNNSSSEEGRTWILQVEPATKKLVKILMSLCLKLLLRCRFRTSFKTYMVFKTSISETKQSLLNWCVLAVVVALLFTISANDIFFLNATTPTLLINLNLSSTDLDLNSSKSSISLTIAS